MPSWISASSSCVNSTSAAAMFSSTRCNFVVPGISQAAVQSDPFDSSYERRVAARDQGVGRVTVLLGPLRNYWESVAYD